MRSVASISHSVYTSLSWLIMFSYSKFVTNLTLLCFIHFKCINYDNMQVLHEVAPLFSRRRSRAIFASADTYGCGKVLRTINVI